MPLGFIGVVGFIGVIVSYKYYASSSKPVSGTFSGLQLIAYSLQFNKQLNLATITPLALARKMTLQSSFLIKQDFRLTTLDKVFFSPKLGVSRRFIK